MRANSAHCIYVLGEKQTTLLSAEEDIFSFAHEHMGEIPTAELQGVLAQVFGYGHLFPGPATALGALLHEYVARSGLQLAAEQNKGLCFFLTAFQTVDNDILVRAVQAIPFDPAVQMLTSEQDARQLVVETLPQFQDAFSGDAYTPDSQLVSLIKDATLYHINKKLD